ncbi:alpha/beta fold hydrolase [Modestobacter sp. I12A-02662]|uniref:alpha/beta fold hydrolase n=1 Tax=Modestobacter sp. I12A-02662 TaxID=1730496 RepID=UPI0034DFAFF5
MARIGVRGGAGADALRRITVNDVSLAYREVGSGDAVVFVHGGVSDLRTWAGQLEPIGTRARAIAYSRRYAWPNDDITPGAADPMSPHVDDLVALLHVLDASPAHLVGNSWGGLICLLTAVRHPEVVRSLVLEEPPLLPLVLGAGPRPRPGTLVSSLVRRPRATLAALVVGVRTFAPMAWAHRRGDEEHAWRVFARGVLGRDAVARLTPEREQQMRDNASLLRAELRAGFPPLSEADVQAIDAPTLLVSGGRSPAVVTALSDWLPSLVRQARQVRVPDASHLVHEDDAPFVNALVLDFISDLGERRSGG